MNQFNSEMIDQELDTNDLSKINGGLFSLLLAALLPGPANAPAQGDDIYEKPGVIEVIKTGSTLGSPDGTAGVWAGEDGKGGCTDRNFPL